MRALKRFTLLVLIMTTLTAMGKDGELYQIEVIGYIPNSQGHLRINESIYPPSLSLINTVTLDDNDDVNLTYNRIPKRLQRFNLEAYRLAKHFPILFHLSWRQQLNKGKPVFISADIPHSDERLIGQIRVNKGYYFYFNGDFSIGEHIAIHHERRMRRNELHYMDNENLAILAEVHPLGK